MRAYVVKQVNLKIVVPSHQERQTGKIEWMQIAGMWRIHREPDATPTSGEHPLPLQLVNRCIGIAFVGQAARRFDRLQYPRKGVRKILGEID